MNYLVASHQNDAFVTVRVLVAAAAGTVGPSSHRDLLLPVPGTRSAQPKACTRQCQDPALDPTEDFPRGISCCSSMQETLKCSRVCWQVLAPSFEALRFLRMKRRIPAVKAAEP